MQQTGHYRISILAGAAFVLTALTGCGENTGSVEAKTKNSSAATTAAPPLDPRIQTLADEQAKGREADARKQATAMQKASTQ